MGYTLQGVDMPLFTLAVGTHASMINVNASMINDMLTKLSKSPIFNFLGNAQYKYKIQIQLSDRQCVSRYVVAIGHIVRGCITDIHVQQQSVHRVHS